MNKKVIAMSSRIVSLLFLFSVVLSGYSVSTVMAQEGTVGMAFYVSLSGDDKNTGTLDAPFKTLERAKDAVRTLKSGKGLPVGGVTVYLRGGNYQINKGFQLEQQDSGTQTAPITYTSYPGEKVSILGGYVIEPSAFQPVSDQNTLNRIPQDVHGKVMQVNLKALGIVQYDEIPKNGQGWPSQFCAPELIINDSIMTLGRWPNEGYVQGGEVIDPGSKPNYNDWSNRGPTFEYLDSRPERWSKATDIWMHGYWYNGWADDNLKIETIDTAKKTIKAVQPSYYALRKGDVKYYYYNLLEEIDMPGEWYLDRQTGIAYVYPPKSIQDSTIHLSMMTDDIISMNNVSHVILKDLSIGSARGNGIKMTEGNDNTVTSCMIGNVGLDGIHIDGGKNQSVLNSYIYNLGQSAVVAKGGDRLTLTPGNHSIDNNRITGWARHLRGRGIALGGVTNQATHNLIHGSGDQAISYRNANEMIIEYNEIYDTNAKINDSGIITSGRSFLDWGNKIRYNYIHDSHGAPGYNIGGPGVYPDDNLSGTIITHNIFDNLDMGVFLNGGRSTQIDNNIITNSKKSISIVKRTAHETAVKEYNESELPKTELWKTKYPEMANVLQDEPDLQKYHKINTNIIYNTGGLDVNSSAIQYGKIENNFKLFKTPFVNLQEKDFRVMHNQQPHAYGFEPIDAAQIGLQPGFAFANQNDPLDRIYVRTDRTHSGHTKVNIGVNEQTQLTVTGKTVIGYPVDFSKNTTVTYTSDNAAVAEVNSSGLITAKGTGVAKITATVTKGNITKSIDLYVFIGDQIEKLVLGVERTKYLSQESDQINVLVSTKLGEAFKLDAPVQFTSKNPDIVSVDPSGRLSTAALGNAEIETVSQYKGVNWTGTLQLEVASSIAKEINVDVENQKLKPGETSVVKVSIQYSDGQKQVPTPEQVTYNSDDKSIVTMGKDGILKAIKPGKTTIGVEVIVDGVKLVKHPIYVLVEGEGGSSQIDIPADIAESEYRVYVNDKAKFLRGHVPPQLVNDRLLVPFRALFEELDGKVEWDGNTNTVTATKGDNTVVLKIDSTKALVNGQEKILDVPAKIIYSSTMVPVRFISEGLGYGVEWDAASKTAYIGTKKDGGSQPLPTPKSPVSEGQSSGSKVILEETFDGFNVGDTVKDYAVKYAYQGKDCSAVIAEENGTKVLKITDKDPGPRKGMLLDRKLPEKAQGKVTIEMKVMAETTKGQGSINFQDAAGSTGFEFRFDIEAKMRSKKSGQWFELTHYEGNEWYIIKVVADTNLKLFDIYINGEKKESSVELASPIDAFENINLTMYGVTGVYNIEYIKITQE